MFLLRVHSHNGVKVEIFFTAVGKISLPDEQEIIKLIQESQQKKDGAKVIRLTA